MRIDEGTLATSLTPFAAVGLAYPSELESAREAVIGGLPVLIECDKQLVPFFYRCLRDRLRAEGREVVYLDGRPRPEDPPGLGLMGRMIHHLADAVRGSVTGRVLVLPHLDLVAASGAGGGLSSEAREMVALLYENPTIVWVGFKDLTLSVPQVIQRLFPRRVHILGVPRDRLHHLVTQGEARKFGQGLEPFRLYRHVSGVNAVQLRRVLGAVDGEDYPVDPTPAWDQLRRSTLTSDIVLPELDLHEDIGGYDSVKTRLQQEIIDLVQAHAASDDAASARRIEGLVPRGIIFHGPPGTGKTLFAKAMARSLGAAVIVVSGPELKSKWVGESEANLRRVFVQARQSAPSVLIFDELDSFASARGTYDGGAGVEHAMVNTLLTEMDGFRRNEMVFVVGTTNFVSSLDGALMRPGRFEFHLAVTYPNREDRRSILEIYDKKMGLAMTDEALTYAVRRTGDPVEGTNQAYTGDHIQAACRALARQRLRDDATEPSTIADVERALTAHVERPRLTAYEERVVAIHECGHAICAMSCAHAPPVQRITILGDLGGSLGMTRLEDSANRHVITRNELMDRMCVLMGGRAAEQVLLDDLSAGSSGDLSMATDLARMIVQNLGMGSTGTGRFELDRVSDQTRASVDDEVFGLLQAAEVRALALVRDHRDEVLALTEALLEHKTLDATHLENFTKGGTDG